MYIEVYGLEDFGDGYWDRFGTGNGGGYGNTLENGSGFEYGSGKGYSVNTRNFKRLKYRI